MIDKLDRKNIDKTKIDWNGIAEYWNDYDEAKDYTKNIIRLLSERIDLKNLNILEFGCGTGLLTDHITKKASQVVAIDTSEKMIEVLDNKNYNNVKTINNELCKATIESNQILLEKFDLIVAVSVCSFLPNYDEVLANIKSLLKPKGIYIQWDWLQIEKDPSFGFTQKMIEDNFNQVGLIVESFDIPFFMMENEEKMEVIMAIGKI